MTIEVSRSISSKDSVIVSNVVNYLEQTIQLHCQDAGTKSGLVVGDQYSVVTGILICLDITEVVLDEAIEKECNLLITHHPLLLQPLVSIAPENYAGRCVTKAIKNGLSIYVFGTNLDHLGDGTSHRIAHLIELQKIQPIVPQKAMMHKLTTFVPPHAEKGFIAALCQVGAVLATHNLAGFVSSAAVHMHYATDAASRKASLEVSQENQLTFIVPTHSKERIMQALWQVHPYEKAAYYLEQIELTVENKGGGVIGLLPLPLPAKYFLKYAKTKLALTHFQHTNYCDQLIHTVAIYAGEGGGLLKEVMHKQIDAFITTGLQYEQFLEANGKILMIDIGYYAARLGLKKLILALLSKKFNNIAILRCKTITNPVYYIND